MPIVFLSLGSNVGDRRSNLESACRELERYLDGLRRSPIYETEPQEVTDQPSFLNMVVEGRVDLNPQELLATTHSIEVKLGRNRAGERQKGPRTLDIDILLYDDVVRTGTPPLLPHPRMDRRQFVLIPLLALAPDISDPRTGERYAEISRRLPPQGIYSG